MPDVSNDLNEQQYTSQSNGTLELFNYFMGHDLALEKFYTRVCCSFDEWARIGCLLQHANPKAPIVGMLVTSPLTRCRIFKPR
jgi:hypothetical protein